MGSLLHPVGSEEPRVYWVRRALVLLTAAALVAALAWAVWPRSDVVTAVPAGTSPSPTAGGTPSVSPSSSAGPSTPAGPVACDPATLRLTVAGFQRVKVSTKQAFTLSVINGGTQPCILTISPQTYSLTVHSGDDRIWSTADCAKWLPAKKLTVKPESAHEFKVEWPLRRSSATCKTTKDTLKPGTYVATAVLLEKANAKQVMQLVR